MAESDSTPYGVIYVVTHLVSGKQYVGQTVSTLKARWKGHCNGKKGIGILVDAIKKYGRESFSMAQIDVAYSKTELDEKEIFHIARLCTLKSQGGYNIKEGGGGTPRPKSASVACGDKLRGRKLPQEQKDKISARKIGVKASPEHVAKMIAAKIGYRHTDEARLRMSVASMGKKMPPVSDIHRERLSIASKIMWAKRKLKQSEQVKA